MPTITIKKMTGGDMLFFLAYGLFLIAGILSTSLYYKYYAGTPHKVIIVIILLLLIAKELYENRMTKKSLLNLAIIVMVFFLVNYVGSVSFAAMFILIWSARNIDFKRIAKFTIHISFILFIFIVLSSYLGIIDNVVALKNNRIRHYLGFRYALVGPAVLYNINTLYLYTKKAEIKWSKLLMIFVVNYWVYSQTDSRLSFYLTVLVMLSCIVLKYFPTLLEKRRLLCYGMICSFWICALLSIGLTIFYDSSVPWMSSLNTFLGTRLNLGRNSILEYGVTLFGQRVSWHGWGLDINGEVSKLSYTNYNYVDCAYLNVLQHYGVLVLLICLIALTGALIRCYRKKNYYMLILLAFVALHAMIDDLIIYLYYNTLWFVIVAPIEEYMGCRQNIRGGVSQAK